MDADANVFPPGPRRVLGLSDVTAAVEAFEADKQLVLSVTARQAESQLQGGSDAATTVSAPVGQCRAVYGERR